jgi:hypothetical protein
LSHPLYKKLEKPEPTETVTRHTSLAQLIWIVTRGELPLIRIDLFRDPFEGAPNKSLIDQQIILGGGMDDADQEMWVLQRHYPNYDGSRARRQKPGDWQADVGASRKNRTYSTHASCWRWGAESEGMWRLYCGEKEGVAFQTTFARLEKSVEGADILAGKIRYGNYKTMDPFNEELDHVMYKREGFKFEQEVRLLKADEDYYRKLCTGVVREKLPPCLPTPWSAKGAVDRILVSPYADDWYMDAVRASVRLVDTDLEVRVGWSDLWGKPDFG